MEREGLSPLRILRHALTIADVFTADLYFMESDSLIPAKNTSRIGNTCRANLFSGTRRRRGQTLSSRKDLDSPTSGNRVGVDLRALEGMDQPQMLSWQSSRKEGWARKPM
jgi:hypothetical protein